MDSTIAADSTVRSQDSANSSDSKDTKVSKMSDDSTRSSSKESSKPESCIESKHSKDQLIDTDRSKRHHHHHHHHPEHQQQQQLTETKEPKDDSNVLMFTSCGQLLLGILLVVFGILTLIHGASMSGLGCGIWAGIGALTAGALGVVATLSSSGQPIGSTRPNSSFSSAHLAASLVALALSNLSVIIALSAVIRDSQRSPPDVAMLEFPTDADIEVEEGWEGLLSSIGLLTASLFELLVSGYTCFNLTPKLCNCLRSDSAVDIEEVIVDGKTLKTRNMVQQWVIAQNHGTKNQPIYVVQPMVPVHPLMQAPYRMHPATAGKYASASYPPPSGAAAYGAMPMMPAHVAYPPPTRPPSQMRSKQPKKRRHSSDQSDNGCGGDPRHRRPSSQHHRSHSSSPDEHSRHHSRKQMAPIGEDQLDLARTYTGLDKRISEEFISIAMDPERKSKASSHHGSEITATSTRK